MLIKFGRAIFDGTDEEYEEWLKVIACGDSDILQAFASEVSPPAAFEMCCHLIEMHPKLNKRLREANQQYIRRVLDQVPDTF